MHSTQKLISSVWVLLAMGAVSACGGGGGNSNGGGGLNNPPPPEGITIKQLDATAGGLRASATDPANKYTYFSFSKGDVVELTDAEAESSTEWDIAFKRSEIKLNGGASGPSTVSGALADAQEDFYDGNGKPNASVFLNADAGIELSALEAVTDVSALSFASDRHIPKVISDGGDDSWWGYNPRAHSVEAASDNWWLVRSAEGNSYAKFHVTDIVQATRDITLELFIQSSDEESFSTIATSYTAAIGAAGGSKCYDIDTTAEVDCSAGDIWDLKIEVTASGRVWNIWTNGGVSGDGNGEALGPLETAEIDTYVSGTTDSADNDLSAHYHSDASGGLFVDNSWYAYNVTGNPRDHLLYPNYRVYAIDTGSAQYALQIQSYYDNAATGGWYTIRYKEL